MNLCRKGQHAETQNIFLRLCQVAFIGLLCTNVKLSIADAQTGYFQVQEAFLNIGQCNSTGKPTHYASQYLRISKQEINDASQFKVSTCDGETLDELFCDGKFSSTPLAPSKVGYEGYYFNAHVRSAKNGVPSCQLTALRRRVVPGKGGFIRYERTDWGISLADYSFECTRETAEVFFDAQSLKCSTHIVIDALKVSD